jgi:hypothetical protein
LPLLNAAYILALAFKGYQIQQIGLYLYGDISIRITALTGGAFNTWEEWRRTQRREHARYVGPELVRILYFAIISAIPVSVSGALLYVYWHFIGATQALSSGDNIYCYFIVMVTITAAAASAMTTQQNGQWSQLIEARQELERRIDLTRRVSPISNDAPPDKPHPWPRPIGARSRAGTLTHGPYLAWRRRCGISLTMR